MYNVFFSEKALKQFRKFGKNIQLRIVNSLKRIKVRPEDFIEKLRGHCGYKFRVGDLRLIIDIDITKKKLFVICIGHRKNIYKR